MGKLLIKQFILIALIILAILSIVFGSYLPLVKSRRFIAALSSVASVKTVQEFMVNFDKSFKFYSPIGDEEITKFLVNDVLQLISQPTQSEAVDRALVNYIEPYLFKNDLRHLMATGEMHRILWEKYGREEDFTKAEDYFNQAYKIGPNVPPVLYSMINLYLAKRDILKVKEIGGIVLQYWPDDENIRNLLKTL